MSEKGLAFSSRERYILNCHSEALTPWRTGKASRVGGRSLWAGPRGWTAIWWHHGGSIGSSVSPLSFPENDGTFGSTPFIPSTWAKKLTLLGSDAREKFDPLRRCPLAKKILQSCTGSNLLLRSGGVERTDEGSSRADTNWRGWRETGKMGWFLQTGLTRMMFLYWLERRRRDAGDDQKGRAYAEWRRE